MLRDSDFSYRRSRLYLGVINLTNSKLYKRRKDRNRSASADSLLPGSILLKGSIRLLTLYV